MPIEPISLPAIDPLLAVWLKGLFIGAGFGVAISFAVLHIAEWWNRRLK